MCRRSRTPSQLPSKKGGSKEKGGGANPTKQSGSSNKPYERKDKGKDKTFSDGKPKNRYFFLSGGLHFARECPQRQKLNAIVAAHEQKWTRRKWVLCVYLVASRLR